LDDAKVSRVSVDIMVIYFNGILILVIYFKTSFHFISSKLNTVIITLLMPFSVDNLKGIEEHLNNHPTLSEGGVPGPVDANIFLALKSKHYPM
jgi:hypothetical protein